MGQPIKLSRNGRDPLAPADLPTLEAAILQAVAYVDMFDYPLSAAEIHRYLPGLPATPRQVSVALAEELLPRRQLGACQGYYSLPGREGLAATRQRRAEQAARLWPLAEQYGRIIAGLPFVRMVAVTGSLAVDNPAADSDVDYLIVTASGRLWLCRALVILVVRLAARRGVSLCPNYFLSERRLVLDDHNLYTARELAQMAPLSGLAVYERLRHLNDWVEAYLPNADGYPRPANGRRGASRRGRGLKTAAEWLLRLPPGAWAEKWEMGRKIARFSRDGGDEAAFAADWCKGHFKSHGQRALAAFERRWQQVGGRDIR
ncbi:MAG: hypothetical protein ACRDHL_12350 [Candidatus Promineifilaceae bacterium]